jgi:ribonuclease HII
MVSRASRRWLVLRRFDDEVRARAGVEALCGADEVGRGPLAGPLVAAAVCLARGAKLPGLDDSKALDPERRRELARLVRQTAVGVAWAFVGPRAVDLLNTHRASLLAMRRSVRRLAARVPVGYALIDGPHAVPDLPCAQQAVVDGDARSLAVAAASVVAKCLRDRFMERLALEFPQYGFERHKGYGTAEHLGALAEHGPCPWHRFSFAPVSVQDLFAAAGPAAVEAD